MNVPTDQHAARSGFGENSRLWDDGRIWWVNCVAIEAAWSSQHMGHDRISEARRRRDAILAAVLGEW